MCPWFDSWRYHLKRQNPLSNESGFFVSHRPSKACFRKDGGNKKHPRRYAAEGFGIFTWGTKGTQRKALYLLEFTAITSFQNQTGKKPPPPQVGQGFGIPRLRSGQVFRRGAKGTTTPIAIGGVISWRRGAQLAVRLNLQGAKPIRSKKTTPPQAGDYSRAPF